MKGATLAGSQRRLFSVSLPHQSCTLAAGRALIAHRLLSNNIVSTGEEVNLIGLLKRQERLCQLDTTQPGA
jgi:hypothetical protein